MGPDHTMLRQLQLSSLPPRSLNPQLLLSCHRVRFMCTLINYELLTLISYCTTINHQKISHFSSCICWVTRYGTHTNFLGFD